MNLTTIQKIMKLVLHLSAAQMPSKCPPGFEDLLDGTTCKSAEDCLALTNTDSYNCVNGYCCKNKNFCGVNEVSIAGVCYPVSGPGGDCIYSSQCQPSHFICRNGMCIDENPDCMDPSHVAEKIDGIVKSCLEDRCSPGFTCEYHPTFMSGDYICCGNYDDRYNYNYGIVRYYPGTRLPLECFETYSCRWVETPYCVYSEQYGHNVCCSTYNC